MFILITLITGEKGILFIGTIIIEGKTKNMNKGFIKISNHVYHELWDDIYILFKDFRPTHIEFRHWENDIWYFYGESKFLNH